MFNSDHGLSRELSTGMGNMPAFTTPGKWWDSTGSVSAAKRPANSVKRSGQFNLVCFSAMVSMSFQVQIWPSKCQRVRNQGNMLEHGIRKWWDRLPSLSGHKCTSMKLENETCLRRIEASSTPGRLGFSNSWDSVVLAGWTATWTYGLWMFMMLAWLACASNANWPPFGVTVLHWKLACVDHPWAVPDSWMRLQCFGLPWMLLCPMAPRLISSGLPWAEWELPACSSTDPRSPDSRCVRLALELVPATFVMLHRLPPWSCEALAVSCCTAPSGLAEPVDRAVHVWWFSASWKSQTGSTPDPSAWSCHELFWPVAGLAPSDWYGHGTRPWTASAFCFSVSADPRTAAFRPSKTCWLLPIPPGDSTVSPPRVWKSRPSLLEEEVEARQVEVASRPLLLAPFPPSCAVVVRLALMESKELDLGTTSKDPALPVVWESECLCSCLCSCLCADSIGCEIDAWVVAKLGTMVCGKFDMSRASARFVCDILGTSTSWVLMVGYEKEVLGYSTSDAGSKRPEFCAESFAFSFQENTRQLASHEFCTVVSDDGDFCAKQAPSWFPPTTHQRMHQSASARQRLSIKRPPKATADKWTVWPVHLQSQTLAFNININNTNNNINHINQQQSTTITQTQRRKTQQKTLLEMEVRRSSRNRNHSAQKNRAKEAINRRLAGRPRMVEVEARDNNRETNRETISSATASGATSLAPLQTTGGNHNTAPGSRSSLLWVYPVQSKDPYWINVGLCMEMLSCKHMHIYLSL